MQKSYITAVKLAASSRADLALVQDVFKVAKEHVLQEGMAKLHNHKLFTLAIITLRENIANPTREKIRSDVMPYPAGVINNALAEAMPDADKTQRQKVFSAIQDVIVRASEKSRQAERG